MQASFLSIVCARVPADRFGDCEGPLSVAECFAALSGMARGKARASMDYRWNFI